VLFEYLANDDQGACSGIGLALTRTLAALGAVVYGADIASTAPQDIRIHERVHLTLQCNVSDRQACKAFLDSIVGRLDGVVNCAGIAGWEGRIGTDELYQETMAVNVTGTWNMATEALQRMSDQEKLEVPGVVPGSVRSIGQGSIVNVGSGASLRGVAGLAAYTASKHAVLGLTRSWARDFPKLRVNLVAPGQHEPFQHRAIRYLLTLNLGATDTPLVAASAVGAPVDDPKITFGKAQVAAIPKGRMAYATDIADAIVFLLSDWSSFVTGQCLPVNGGHF
jgi:NAD(P)-dependent dehydrogenase (short-subunit alcohol dehydrogenase family)